MDQTNSSLRIILWGFGNMNKIILRYVLEKKIGEIVGVIGHHDIGQDARELVGLEKRDVLVSDEQDAVKLIKRTKPNVCMLATRSFMDELVPVLQILGEHGVNTVTIAEEAFYAWTTSPIICKEIDEIFKNNDCTFTGTGTQDIFWGYLPGIFVGASHKINRIIGCFQYNVDDYGRALCEAHGVGLTQDEFAKQFRNSNDVRPSYVLNSNAWLCAYLGWRVESNKQELWPIICEKDINSKSLGTVVKAGYITGMKAIVTTVTKDGIKIETTMIGQVYHDDLIDMCIWKLEGEPNTEIIINRPATAEVTCATAVNRIQQVVNSKGGYVTTDKFGPIVWKFH